VLGLLLRSHPRQLQAVAMSNDSARVLEYNLISFLLLAVYRGMGTGYFDELLP
jgi:hypothetical protein